MASSTPLFAQEDAAESSNYRTPPIPFSAPQLGQVEPTPTTVPTATPVATSTAVQGTIVDSAVVGNVAVDSSAVASTAAPITIQPLINAFPQAPVSVGLSSSSAARPNESASTIVDRLAATSTPDQANVLGVRRIGEDWTYPSVGPNERWMRVDLSEQTIFAYEGQRSVATFIGSTGTDRYPTVTGLFRVRMKVSEQTMSGGSGSEAYSLPGVQWVMYFHSGYAFHGTYWHTNFGTPQSHGCVNLTNDNAKWLFDWAGPVWDGQTTWFPSTESNPGSLVLVHQ